jgi:hypothetical protein
MDLPSALSHIEALQKQLAEKNAELSEVGNREEAAEKQAAQLNDAYEKLREWVALGLVPRPGPDDLNRMSELRASLKAFWEVTLGTQEPVAITSIMSDDTPLPEKLRRRSDRAGNWAPPVLVDLTGDAAAESKEINNQAAQLNDAYEKLREWVALGLVPRPGPDDLNRMSELRASLKAFWEVTLGTQEPVVGLAGDAGSREITPAAVMEE